MALEERLMPYRDFMAIRMFIGSMDNTEYGNHGAMGCWNDKIVLMQINFNTPTLQNQNKVFRMDLASGFKLQDP